MRTMYHVALGANCGSAQGAVVAVCVESCGVFGYWEAAFCGFGDVVCACFGRVALGCDGGDGGDGGEEPGR